MNLEFFNDKSGAFKPGINFLELGSEKYTPFEEISEMTKKRLFMLFLDNQETKKLIDYQYSHGVKNRDEVLKYIIIKKFSGLNRSWDIDDNKLNFD